MNTCANCFYWDEQKPGDDSANCILDPPKVIPIMGLKDGKPFTTLQNIYPTTAREQRACQHFDSRARPVIKVTSMMPSQS